MVAFCHFFCYMDIFAGIKKSSTFYTMNDEIALIIENPAASNTSVLFNEKLCVVLTVCPFRNFVRRG